jgi:hypothetical protein
MSKSIYITFGVNIKNKRHKRKKYIISFQRQYETQF